MKKIGKLSYIESIKTKKYAKLVIGIILGVLIAGSSVYYATTILYNSQDVGYNTTNSGLTANNVQGAIDELYQKANLQARIEALTTITQEVATTTTNVKSGTIRYTTKGGWCYIVGNAVSMTSGSSGNHQFSIANGLPVPADSNGVYAIPTGSNGQKTKESVYDYGRYIWLNGNGVLYVVTWGSTTENQYFSMAYPIANS